MTPFFNKGWVPVLTSSLLFCLSFSIGASQQCTPINIEIFQDYAALANEDYKSGTYDVCPPEAMYWKVSLGNGTFASAYSVDSCLFNLSSY